MRVRALLGLVSLLAAVVACSGCGDPDTGGTAELLRPAPKLRLDEPVPYDETGLALRLDGVELRVGEAERAAMQKVARPRGAYDTQDPSPLEGDDWKVRGWASQEAAFGVLTLDGRVALAVFTREKAPSDWFNELLSAHERAYSLATPRVVAGSSSSYWFWSRGQDRLMICRTRGVDGTTSATVAVGLAAVMDELRMNEQDAASDLSQAQRLLTRSPGP